MKYYDKKVFKSKKSVYFRNVNILELNLIELKQKNKFLTISNRGIKEYYCYINNLYEFDEFLNERGIFENDDNNFIITGIITFEMNLDFMYRIEDFIFLEDVNVNGNFSLTIFSANECIFLKNVNVLGSKEINEFSITFSNSLFKSHISFFTEYYFDEVFFYQCKFYYDIMLQGMNTKKLIFEFSDFIGIVNCENMYILDKLNLSGNTFYNHVSFYDSIFDAEVTFELNEFTKSSELNIANCRFYKRALINFEKIDGTFKIFDSIFTAKCFLNPKNLDYENYKVLKIYDENDYSGLIDGIKSLDAIRKINVEKTKLNFYQISEIHKSNGNIDSYLDTYFLHKVYERKQLKENIRKKENKNKILDYFKYYSRLLFEKSSKYCTDWKRCFTSIIIIIIFSSLVYSLFPCYLNTSIKSFPCGNIFIWIHKIYHGEFNWPNFNRFLDYIGTILYYGVITFTTIGYGDISPNGWLRFIASLEGFLGVFMTSLFGVAVTKRFLG